jgi:hypothetical protein
MKKYLKNKRISSKKQTAFFSASQPLILPILPEIDVGEF